VKLLRQNADLVVAVLLFVSLAALSWRRWASFTGDLSREWTTPARVAAGERLYRDVAFYYGPLAPYAEGLAMRVFGSRVGTVIAFDLATAAGTLALILLASRAFLPLAGRCALACVAVGVFAFAPENGTFVACYSQSALLAVALAWLAFLLAQHERPIAAGLAGGLALLSKVEAAPALLAAFLVARKGRPRLAAAAAGLAAIGYALAFAGLGLDDLIHYGPLRHLALPPEFRELYLRISGLHPDLLARGAFGAAIGAALALGWLLAVPSLLALVARARAEGDAPWPEGAAPRAAIGGPLLALGLALHPLLGDEPLLTTLTRGLPLVLVAALAASSFAALRGEPEARANARLAAAAALIGLAFVWRTFLWTVPSLPYAPLAAVSSLPAVCWLLSRAAPRVRLLVLTPLLAAPLLFLPRLVVFYRASRTCVEAPRGTWCPPGDEGELYSKLVGHLTRAGVKDRSLVAIPEASALGFLLGVKSPLRLEQLLPGLLDGRADLDATWRMEQTRPERVVVIDRPTDEYGGKILGRDYGLRLAALIAREYRPEVKFESGRLRGAVLVRNDLAELGGATGADPPAKR
jgi:hypothetical protein